LSAASLKKFYAVIEQAGEACSPRQSRDKESDRLLECEADACDLASTLRRSNGI
jgi:hypothetical protein